MKRRIILLTLASMILLLQGCNFPQKYPIEGMQNILIGGVDVEGDEIVLTTYVDDISQSSKPSEEQIQYKLYMAKGKTINEANTSLHTFNEKYLSWFHAKYIIFGEETAKTGLDRLLSFFAENEETKLLFRLAVVKGFTAKDFLQKASSMKESLVDYLDTLFEIAKKTGKTREIHLINYAIDREIPWNDTFIPAIELLPNPAQPSSAEGGSGGESNNEYIIKLGGFALFNGDKLSGLLENDMATSLNILNNELLGAQITVASKNNHMLSIELVQSNTDIHTNYYPMSVKINVSADASLIEYHDGDDPMDQDNINYIQRQASEYLKQQILQTILYMQQIDCDAAEFGDKFYHSNPVKWQQIKDKWEDIFPQVQFNVNVAIKIRSTYEFKDPVF